MSDSWPRGHLLDVADATAGELEALMEGADKMRERLEAGGRRTSLAGMTVTLLFYESSTRTRVSFETAARRLGADVVSVAAASSSVTKGESLVDTVRTLQALGTDVLVMRHPRSGAPYLAARVLGGGHVINAGDGWHAHPTQALVDLYTLRQRLPGRSVRGRKIVILGDIVHSRVARSNIWSLTSAGADVWLCGPGTLVQGFAAWARAMPRGRSLKVTTDVQEALRDADAVMALRLQQERMSASFLPSVEEYAVRYGLTAERLKLARPGAPVLHPGPMNEGVEIAPDVAAGRASAVMAQVANGIAVRMAVLERLAGRGAG